MENQPPPHNARRKNSQPVKSPAGESSQPPHNPPIMKETATTNSTATPSTTVHPLVDESDPEQIMNEFLRKFGSKEKASDVFARIAEELQREEDASRLAPLQIPTRPETLTETPTCRAISETVISDTTTVITSTQPESHIIIPTSEERGDEREEEEGNRKTVGDEGVESAGNVNEGDRESGEKEIIESMGSGDRASEGVVGNIDGGKQGKGVVGEPRQGGEGEIPKEEDVEGDIHVDIVAEDAEKGESVEREVPEELGTKKGEGEIVDEDDIEDDDTEKVDMEVDRSELSDRPELVEGTKFIVVPDEGPEAEDTPATARESRWHTRLGKKLEGTRTSTRRLHLIDSDNEGEDGDDIPETQEGPEETGEDVPRTEETPEETGKESPQAQGKPEGAEESSHVAEEKHYAKERK